MLERHIDCLLVHDQLNQLAGVVTPRDFMKMVLLFHRVCTECLHDVDGSVFMLHDRAYCSADCRLQGCRREASSASRAHLPARSKVSPTPIASHGSTSGLMASYPSWL